MAPDFNNSLFDMSGDWVNRFDMNNSFTLVDPGDLYGGSGGNGYYYDSKHEVYKNGFGEVVSFEEYYDNYSLLKI